VKKKQNFEIYRAASNGGQGKSFPRPLLEAALSIFKFNFF
jgi:hypothetical protein